MQGQLELAKAYCKRNDSERARTTLTQVLQLNPTLEVYERLIPLCLPCSANKSRQLAEESEIRFPGVHSLFLSAITLRAIGEFTLANKKAEKLLHSLGGIERAIITQYISSTKEFWNITRTIQDGQWWSLNCLLEVSAKLTYQRISQLNDASLPTILLLNFIHVGTIFRDYLNAFQLLQDRYHIVRLLTSADVPSDNRFSDLYLRPKDVRYLPHCSLVVADGPDAGPFIPESQKSLLLFHGAFLPPSPRGKGYSFFDFGFTCTKFSTETAMQQIRCYRRKTKHKKTTHLIPTPNLKIAFSKDFKSTPPKEKIIAVVPTDPTELPNGASAFFRAEKIIAVLHQNLPDYKILFRPFPWLVEEPVFRAILERFEGDNRVIIDTSAGSTQSLYERTCVFVTDASSGGFSFLTRTGRPSIFLLPRYHVWLHKPLRRYVYYCKRYAIWASKAEGIPRLVKKLEKTAHLSRRKRTLFQREQLYSTGKAEEHLRANVEAILQDRPKGDWLRV